MIIEKVDRRGDGSIDLAALDDGEGCYLFLEETAECVVLTHRFEQGGSPLGKIRLSPRAVAKLAPLFAEIAARN